MKILITFIFLAGCIFVNGQSFNAKDSAVKFEAVDRGAYVIQYPKTWAIDTTKQLGADLFIFSQSDSVGDKFRENVNVMIQDLKGLNIDLDKYIAVSEEQIRNMVTKAQIIESKRINQSGREFHKLIFSGDQGIFALKVEQYYFLFNEKAFVVTLTTEHGKFDTYREIGEEILRSFSINE